MFSNTISVVVLSKSASLREKGMVPQIIVPKDIDIKLHGRAE